MLALLLVLDHPTVFMLGYVIDMALVSLVLFHLYESGEMGRRFGGTYTEYARQVRNWLPRWRPRAAANSRKRQSMKTARP
jgi:protein-S-isoprenylcysteine O-methyltransferase Ste14